jgi:hypothetical protein
MLIWLGLAGADGPAVFGGTPIRFEIAVDVFVELAFAPVWGLI